jgi:hypothetical protein
MTNDMFGIDARRYAALTGLLHAGTCNPARWAGLREAAPLALRDSLQSLDKYCNYATVRA